MLKSIFHLLFNAKILSILGINFDKSFVCNNLDLTDILSKTLVTWITAIRQFDVRQLEKKNFLNLPLNMFKLKKTPYIEFKPLWVHQDDSNAHACLLAFKIVSRTKG